MHCEISVDTRFVGHGGIVAAAVPAFAMGR
jgi:hypothetical protein